MYHNPSSYQFFRKDGLGIKKPHEGWYTIELGNQTKLKIFYNQYESNIQNLINLVYYKFYYVLKFTIRKGFIFPLFQGFSYCPTFFDEPSP